MFRWARLLNFGPQPASPRLYATDEVVPMHLFDNNEMMRSYDLFWTFRFNEVLDADMLAKALSDLIQTGDWRKLGGRYRIRPDGKLELHIPRPFTPDRPPIFFTKESFDVAIDEHELASKLPEAGADAECFSSAREFAPLAYGPGAPRSMADYTSGDYPQLSLHVVTFTNASLVSVNWNHAMSDLGGFAAIIKGWVACLSGKTPPRFMSMSDSMQALCEKPPGSEKLIIADRLLSGWRKAVWVLRFIWDQYWTTSSFQSRTLVVPKQRMDTLLRNCRAEAAREAAVTNSDPFISEGDVAMAFAVRLAAWSLPASSGRTIAATGAVDPRARVPAVFDPNAAYVQNSPSGLAVLRPAADVLAVTVGALALSLRQELAEQTTESQMRLTAAKLAATLRSTGSLPPVGDTSSFFTTCSNWSRSRLLEIMDFAPAIVSGPCSTATSSRKPGLPVFYHSRSLTMGTFTTNMLLVHGRDHNGHMWLGGDSAPEAWERLVGYINSEK